MSYKARPIRRKRSKVIRIPLYVMLCLLSIISLMVMILRQWPKWDNV
jgi:hypothetical protein